jgi:ribosomal protein S14
VAVEVSKQTGEHEKYHVYLEGAGGSCTCPAGTYRGACRHLDICREAFREGLV